MLWLGGGLIILLGLTLTVGATLSASRPRGISRQRPHPDSSSTSVVIAFISGALSGEPMSF
jgi:hypothetical protein